MKIFMTNAEKILEICCDVCGSDLRDRRQTVDNSFKRSIYYNICRQLFPIMTYQHIGSFVNRNHATVIAGMKHLEEIKTLYAYNEMYKKAYKVCKDVLVKNKKNSESELILLRIENKQLRDKLDSIIELCQRK